MYSQEITIKGRIPSKKNSRINCIRNGRIQSFPSKNYKKWHKEAESQVDVTTCFDKPCKVKITFYFPDARKSDLTNKAESIMDLLVDCGVLEDDNYTVVPEILLLSGGIDRVNPRAEVELITTKEEVVNG